MTDNRADYRVRILYYNIFPLVVYIKLSTMFAKYKNNGGTKIMLINDITTQHNESPAHVVGLLSNAEAIDATYYEYHGRHEDDVDNDVSHGYSIVEVAI